jgi:hypothetical protein
VTGLIGASVGLIVASSAALALGWASSQPALIWTSIALTSGAAVCLAIAYQRSVRAARSGPAEPSESEDATAAILTVSSPASPPTARPETPTAVRAPHKPPGSPASPEEEVVAIPDRRKYHRLDCRYAQASKGERMPRAAARRRAYSPCGICKP